MPELPLPSFQSPCLHRVMPHCNFSPVTWIHSIAYSEDNFISCISLKLLPAHVKVTLFEFFNFSLALLLLLFCFLQCCLSSAPSPLALFAKFSKSAEHQLAPMQSKGLALPIYSLDGDDNHYDNDEDDDDNTH